MMILFQLSMMMIWGYVNDVIRDNVHVDVKYDGDVNQHFPCCKSALVAPFLVFIDSLTYILLCMSSSRKMLWSVHHMCTDKHLASICKWWRSLRLRVNR